MYSRVPGRSLYQSVYSDKRLSWGRKTQNPPQTIELYEGSDLEEEAGKLTIAQRLGAKQGEQGYIDTIINFDEKEGKLNIANVVKIGDQYITKEWDCGEEYRETVKRSRSPQRTSKKLTLRDTFDASRLNASKHLFTEDFDESVERNPTLASFTSNHKNFTSKVEHCDCDLCKQDEQVYWSDIKRLSQNRSSTRMKNVDEVVRDEVISFHEDDINGSISRPSNRRSSLRRGGRSESPQRKSVSFRNLVDEYGNRDENSYYNEINKKRKSNSSTSPLRLSASFGIDEPENFDLEEDTAEFEEREFSHSIPREGNKSQVRSFRFSATKDRVKSGNRSGIASTRPGLTNFRYSAVNDRVKAGAKDNKTPTKPDRTDYRYSTIKDNTKASTRVTLTPNNLEQSSFRYSAIRDRARANTKVDATPNNLEKTNYRYSAIKDRTKTNTNVNITPIKPGLTSNSGSYQMTNFERGTIDESSPSAAKSRSKTEFTSTNNRLTKGERTNIKQTNLKRLAIRMKEYGELEQQESRIKDTL